VLQVWDFYRRHTWVPARPPRTVLPIELPLDEVLARIEAERPDVVMGYGSYLEILFRFAAARGGLRHRPAAVLYGADALSPEGWRLLEQELGVRVISTYSAAEAFKIGFTCEEHGAGFHLHADLCHLRIVDATGGDSPPEQPGDVVISNLVNRATVLINYRLGDVAAWSMAPCRCGRALPRLTALAGRSEETLELPGGRLLHPRSVWNLVKKRPEVLRFQVVQRAPDRLELRLLTAERADYDRLAPALRDELRALVGEVSVDTGWLDRSGVPAAAKFRAVIPFHNGGDEGSGTGQA
jgi:phenylacetate-CoA ligase